jgi:hypothetical protein
MPAVAVVGRKMPPVVHVCLDRLLRCSPCGWYAACPTRQGAVSLLLYRRLMRGGRSSCCAGVGQADPYDLCVRGLCSEEPGHDASEWQGRVVLTWSCQPDECSQ